MKKILVGILGIFMVLGGALFAACGSNRVDINLSETYKEIVVLDSDNVEPATITAEVVGISDGRVTATSSQNSIVTASAQYDSSSNSNIITLVPGESEGTATVTVTSFDQSVSKNITVFVHGEVTGMSQGSILSPDGKRYDYAIIGGSVTLNGANLIAFEKTLNTNRTAVTWSVTDGAVGYHIEDDGVTLVVDSDYVGSTVTVEATSVYNPSVSTTITLQVLDNIDLSNLQMRYSYSEAFGDAYDLVGGSVIELTSNIKAGGYKRAHIEFGLNENQDLQITPVVKNQDGLNTDMVTILGAQSPNESSNRYFIVEGKDSANLTVNAYFEVGYRDFAYSQRSTSFQVESYLRVESIGVSSQYGDFASIKQGDEVTDLPTQNIYTSYGQGPYGEKFDVQILPIGVADPDADLYYIEVTYPNDLGSQIEFTSQTLQFYYIGVDGVVRQLSFTRDSQSENLFISEQLSVDSVSSLYVRANAQEPWQSLSGVQVQFRSVANELVSAVGQFNLYHSADSLDFGDVETDVNFASNEVRTETKTLTLYGQTDITGLSVYSNFEYVTVSGINLIESDIEENSVTFSFTITMNQNGLGLTETGHYTIAHANGLREDYQINLFLPLTSASLGYDISTETNGRTDYDENGLLYVMVDGLPVAVDGSQRGISSIMVKKGLSVLLSGQTNRSSARNAAARVTIEYADLSNEDYQDESLREAFRNLTPNDVLGRELNTIGGIVSINDNSSASGQFNFTMTALQEGYAWVVVTFSGYNENFEEVQYKRIFFVESHVAPNEWSLSRTEVEVYARNSVADEDLPETSVKVRLTFSNEAVTYRNATNNFIFEAVNSSWGTRTIEGATENSIRLISWQNGNFTISNVNIYDTYMTFEVNGLTTNGNNEITDFLRISYVIPDADNEGRYLFRLDNVLTVNVMNADRVEYVNWLSYREDGIYYELTDITHENIVLVMQTSPTNAKNSNLRFYLTNSMGAEANFISVSEIDGNGVVRLNATSGASGYLYVLPEDAINDGVINFMVNGVADSIRLSELGMARSGYNGTNYDYLVAENNAYFVNNNDQNIYFSDLIVRIPVLVADGMSFDTAYRIYTSEQFATLNPRQYYTVMNSITLDNQFASFENISGGIQGENQDVTITLSGKNIAQEVSGEIRNITFAGSVRGAGFVADANSGTITNVSVDVAVAVENNAQTFSSSTLTSAETAGGIVGTNTGTIDGASVLGLTISADGQIVGGIAGQNSGTIENSRVEFYNFEKSVNTFTGATVGGLVGEMTGGEISRSYAYDYTMQSDSQAVLNGNSGAFVGSATDGSVNESFAVVGTSNAAQGTISITNSYVSYYDDNDTYTSIYYGQDGKVADEESLSSPFIKNGDNSFLSYVNGGHAHLDFYQDQPYSGTQSLSINRSEYNNFVQSLGAEGDRGVLFFFQPSTMPVDGLSEDEERDIENYNSISTADLLGISEEGARKVVITSSNVNVVLAQNDGIVVRGVGEAVLTIYSQQDYQNSKTINVEVIYSMSKLVASYNFAGGSVEITENEDGTTEVPLQETRSLRVAYAFAQNSVYLGNSASIYTLAQNDIDIEYSAAPDNAQGVALREEASGYFITLNAEVGDVNTLIWADPKVQGLGTEYQNAVTTAFQSRYTVAPFAGAIRIDATNDEVNMSPGTPGYITAVVLSTNDAERLTANISLGGIDLTISPIENLSAGESGSYTFTASLGTQERFNVNVSWTRVAKSENDGTYEYTFEFYFAVAEEYRNHVSANENYDVTFISNSQIVSQNFTLTVSRQEFNNIAVSNYEISSTTYEDVDGQYLTVYTIDPSSTISTVAPGSASIIQVNVNPAYAYYDSFTIEYRTIGGSGVANAVMLDFLMPSPEDNSASPTEFIRNRTATIAPITNGYDITPTDDDKASGNLYFRAWINDAVNEDPQIEYRITFFANEESVGYVTYYQKVSYLRDAQISIVGQVGEDGVFAKGETVTVRVTIEDDETVNLDSIVLLNSAGGITRSNPTEVASTIPNTRAFEFNVSATVTAQTITENGEVLPLQISATVSRIENNVPQTKTVSLALNLVDFRIDGNNIRLDSPIEGEFVTYVGLPQYLQFEYNFLPEDYTYNASDTASVTAVNALRGARNSLTNQGYYLPEDDMLQNYTINVRNGEEVGLIDRLEYYDTSIGQWANVSAGRTLNGIATVSAAQDGTVAIEGLQETADGQEIQMRITTYETVNGVEREYTTSFTVSVEAYSSEDVPICIYTVDEFMAMAGGTAQDYILMNDLHLTGYTPFDTTNISSFDGNGYTIHIDSFNVIPSDTSTLNLALFNNVTSNTTLKNVRVNIFNGGQILADVNRYSQINIAGFAINNAGTITNCDVVAYSADGSYNSSRAYGLNVTYINGSGTSSPVYLPPNSTWQTTVSGFVNENSGSITNSRVGGDEVMVVSDEAGEGLYRLTTYSLQTFNIRAQGDVAGFVGQNSGKIAASYVKNAEIDNLSEDPDKNTAGFVLTNNGSVITSYIEGVRGEKGPEDDNFTNTGSSISSANGIVAGFVYSNEDAAQIIDSYSNILISNVNEGSAAYLAAGFVYSNTGYLKNCYSASQVENLKYSQMNFSGVDENGNLMTTGGTYENCYYYNSSYTSQYSSGSTTEEDFSTGAGQLRDVSLASNFYGFAVSTSDSDDSIWKMTDEGIKLVEANLLTISHRYYNVIEEGENVSGETGATVGDDGEIITYNMPYSTLQRSDGTRYNSAYGSIYNPILIRSAQEFVEVTGTSSSSSVQIYLRDRKISGTYRLVSDIDLSTLLTSEEEQTYVLPSSSRAFTGIFYGNGFTISNISITSSESVFSYGLFGTIEKDDTTRNTLDTMLLNLNLTVSRVSNNAATTVGALSGYVRDAKLINISATFNDDSRVEGLNFAGGLAGLVFNNSLLSNLSVENATVIADRYNGVDPIDSEGLLKLRSTLYTSLSGLSSNKSAYEMTNLKNALTSYSYAGGIAGFVDIFTDGARSANFTAEDYSTTFNGQGFNVYGSRAIGNIYVEGNVVGGLFGLTGSKTHVRDARIEIEGTMNQNSTHIVATRYYAGGVVGQSFGALSQIVATYSDDLLSTINNNYGTYYSNRDMTAERGAIDIFYYGDLTDYTQEYIGGLVGYAGSGSMRVSYSTINVIGLDSKFAGGVIGVIDIGTDVTPYSFNPGNGEVVATKYAIEEVYSSGDVRANTMSGGIVGVIAKANTNVSFSAVNSVNFLSIYDYQNGVNYTNEQLGSAGQDGSYSGNTENALKFNSIVGQFGGTDEEDDETQTDASSTTIEGNYLTLNKVFESYFNESGVLQYNEFASIGKFNNYNFTSGTSLTLTNSYYPGYREHKATFLIQTPSSYTDSTAGRTYTRAAFLDSNAWSNTNWVHYTGQLYPEIKYADLQEATIFLDQYNVSTVVGIMTKNPDVEVMVRGLVSEDASVDSSTSYGDVYLTSNGKADGEPLHIGDGSSEGFAGTLFGNPDYEVSLIVRDTIFNAVSSGLVLRDLDIVVENWVGNNNGVNARGTGVIASSITEAQIANVTLTVNSSVTVKASGTANAGLVAGAISSTSIQGLRIVDGMNTGNLLNVKPDNSTTELSVGLIAGTVTQASTVRGMEISQISISLNQSRFSSTSPQSVINIDNSTTAGQGGSNQPSQGGGTSQSSITTLNAGLYFGQATSTGQPFNINLSGIAAGQGSFGDSNFAQIHVGVQTTNANIGGYIGNVDNITSVSGNFTNRPLNFAVNFASGVSPTLLNYGGLIGVSTAQTLNLRYTQANDSITVYNKLTSSNGTNFSVGSMNYGGLIGQVGSVTTDSAGTTTVSGGRATISGLTAHNSLFGSDNENVSLNTALTDSLSTALTNEEGKNVEEKLQGVVTFTGDLNYGGLIGNTASGANISNFNGGINNSTNNNLLTFTGGSTANVGGVVGKSAESVTISAVSGGANVHDSYNIQAGSINAGGLVGNSGRGVSISGKIVNDGSMNIGKSGTASANNVGGFVGLVTGNVNITGSGEKNLSQYTGHIFINHASTANVGGIVGNITKGVVGSVNNTSDPTGIAYTSFGGTIRIAQASTIRAGGTIGHFGITASPSVQYNYNYGDIYISNGVVESSNDLDLYAGGIIGISNYTADVSGSNVQYNYSLVTINSGKYSQDTESDINALFGSSVQGTSANNNFYNHGVALCTDNFGTDMGYASAYTDGVVDNVYHAGYGEKYNTGDSLIAVIKNALNINNDNNLPSGHKLRPASVGSTIERIENYPANGVYYFALTSDTSPISAQLLENVSQNIALIGDGYTLTYTGNSDSFIPELSGFSYVSSLVLNVDVNLEDTTNTNIGGLVGSMTSGQIYGVGVSGNIEVGGTQAITVAGLVANAGGNVTIRDSYSVADILYRAADTVTAVNTTENKSETVSGSVSGLVGTGGAQIYSSFTGGRLSTYIDANMYAFSQGSHTITNSYTYTTLDWNDHTSEKTEPADTTIISVFGSAQSVTGSYYDKLALNRTDVKVAGSSTSMPTDGWGTFNLKIGDNEYKDENGLYNFGYPVRSNFKYLAPSSLYTREMSDNSKDGTDNKTRGITEYNYTRLSLEKTLYLIGNDNSNVVNTAYGIPNYTVLTKMIGQVGNKYNIYVLTNDIDNYNNTWIPTSLGVSELDGNGHTINNLGATMFTSLSEKNVRNIRLTNDNDLPLANAILAQTLSEKTTVSNVTLSGYIESQADNRNIGALANETEGNVFINAVTNLTHIRKSGINVVNSIGGLVGFVKNGETEIKYSSNYGTIQNKVPETGVVAAPTAGGLVGEVGVTGSLNITYSYNANSVIANYEDKADITSYAGGLVGLATGKVTISYSYNSGIVKAGNKSVGSGENSEAISYAGGIIGCGTTGSITDCFNEGSIEALGANPTYKYTTSYSGSTYTYTINIVVVQEENPVNVRPYGIGYIEEKTMGEEMSLTQVSNSGNVEANGRANIYSNEDPTFTEGETEKHYVIVATGEEDLYKDMDIATMWMWMVGDDAQLIVRDYVFDDDLNVTTPSLIEENNEDIIITGYGDLGIPTSIAFVKDYYFEVETKSYHDVGTGVYKEETVLMPFDRNGDGIIDAWDYVPTGEKVEITENRWAVAQTARWKNQLIVHWGVDSNATFEGGNNNVSNGNFSEGANLDRTATRSSETSNSTNEVEIAGKSYYLADANNLTDIFNAGLYNYGSATIKGKWTSKTKRDYTITAKTEKGEDVDTYISSITDTEIIVNLFSKNKLTGTTITVEAKYNYNNIYHLNLSNNNLAYDNTLGAYGVILTNNSTVIANVGYKTDKDGQDNILKLMDLKEYNGIMSDLGIDDVPEDKLPTDGDNSYYYLIIKDNGLYYKPNLQIYINDSSSPTKVNTHPPISNISTDTLSYFVTTFTNNDFVTLGTREGESTVNVNISDYSSTSHTDTLYNASQAVTGKIEVGNAIEGGITFDAGSATTGGITFGIEGTQTNTYNSNMDVFVDVNTESLDQGIVYSISNGANNYASLSYIDGEWVMSSTATEGTFVSDGRTYNFTIAVEENKLKLHFTTRLTIPEGLAGIVASNLGDSLNLNYTDENGENQTVEGVLTDTYQYEEIITQYAYNFNLTSDIDKEFIILGDDNQTPIVARNAKTEEWSVATSGNVTIDGNTYTITPNSDGISLSITSATDLGLKTLQDQMEDFFSDLTMIEEKTPDGKSYSDNFSGAQNGEQTVIDENGLKVTITHDKHWDIKDGNDNFNFSEEDGGLKVELKDDVGIYTLGDVSIQYGTFKFKVEQICKTTAVSATYASEKTTDVARLTVADKHVEDMTGNISITLNESEIETLIGEGNTTYSLNVLAETYPTGQVSSENLESIILIFDKQVDNNVLGKVTYNNRYSVSEGVLQLYESTFLLANPNIELSMTIDRDEDIQTATLSFLDISDDIFMEININQEGQSYTLYFDENGELTEPVEVEDLPSQIYLRFSEGSQPFGLDKEILLNTIDPLMYLYKETALLKSYQNNNIYLTKDLHTEISCENISMQGTDRVNVAQVTTFDIQLKMDISTLTVTDNEKIIINNAIAGQDNFDIKVLNGQYYLFNGNIVDGNNNIITSLDSIDVWSELSNREGMYDKTNGIFNLIYRLPNWNNTLSIFISQSFSETAKIDVDSDAQQSKSQGIILTQDISLGQVDNFVSKDANITISGNGYYLSFYNLNESEAQSSGLWPATEESENDFIKDVKFLAEIKSGFILPGEINYKEISVYGILGFAKREGEEDDDTDVNLRHQDLAIFNSDPGSIDFENNLSIIADDGIYQDGNGHGSSIYIVKTDEMDALQGFSSFSNYGSLFAGNGDHGSKGTNGKFANNTTETEHTKTATPGQAGGDGGGIFVKVEKNLVNNAIAIAGNGGNGGAGGTGGSGKTKAPLALGGGSTAYRPNDSERKTGFTLKSDDFYKPGEGKDGGGAGTGGQNNINDKYKGMDGNKGYYGGHQSGGNKGNFNFWRDGVNDWHITVLPATTQEGEYTSGEAYDNKDPGKDNWLEKYNTDGLNKGAANKGNKGSGGSIAEHLQCVYGRVGNDLSADLAVVVGIEKPQATKPSAS